MPDWRPIRKLTPAEAESVKAGRCWYDGKDCRAPASCGAMTTRCRRELEADCDSGYYGKRHQK